MPNDNKENKSKAVVQYKGEPLTITFSDVKKLICPLADAKEVVVFLKTCQSLNLNPFANEIYLIKYSGKDRAAQVIAIDSYLKAAEVNTNYDGHEAGIILKDTGGKLELREGSFILDEEKIKLAGGWARVYRKDRSKPFYISVNKRECLRYRKDGALTEFWREDKQPSMLRKTALKRAMVEAFPSLFAGFISDVEYQEIPEEVKGKLPKSKGEMEEGELQPAFITNGKPDWSKFWARQAERGIDGPRAHALLKVGSIKADLIDKGKTPEEVDEMLTQALEKERGEEKPLATDTDADTEWDELSHETEPEPKRDPETIKNFGDLYTACQVDFKMTKQQVWAELNVSSQIEIVDLPSECYRRISTVREA